MEVEMSEPSPTYSGKRFEFCDIEWEIENFCLASCNEHWIFQTPEFAIRGFHITKWKMILTCESEEMEFLKLSLKRCDDPGPEIIWVDWRLEMQSPHCDHDSVNKLSCFRKGSLSGEELGVMTSILKALKPFEADLLVLHCKMIIFSEESSEGFHPCTNIGIRSLSEDLLQFFYRNEYRDLELAFKTNSIKVHKVVACSRLKELNFLIEQEGRKSREGESGEMDVVDLSSLNYDAMIRIMKYAYSGDLKHVLGEPSLFLYDCIQKFDIPEVKSYYVPHRLHFRSSANKSEINFAWIIAEKRNLMSNEPMMSPLFGDDSTGTLWQLHLTPSDVEKSDYYDLRVESLAEKEFVACIECGIADNNDYLFPKRMRCPPQASKTYGFNKFLGLNVLDTFSEDKYLSVAVKIRLSDGSTSTRIEKQNVTFIECIPAEKCYYLLSVHMDSAYNAGFFSDFHLEINSIVYKMHKSVIAARSSIMHELVCQMCVDGVNPFSRIDPSIFCMLLRFIYTGVMLESEFEGDFVDLYDTAVNLGLTVLKELCSLCLRVQMQNNLVQRAKVLEISLRHNDEVLQEYARQYLS